jgi:hypothetical protein
VVNDRSVAEARYIQNIYSIRSCLWALVVGALVRWTRPFKWIAIAAIPIHLLDAGLMISFRHPGTNVGYLIMCQIFTAVSGGASVVCEQMAVKVVSRHSQIAAVLAIWGIAQLGWRRNRLVGLGGLLDQYSARRAPGRMLRLSMAGLSRR